MFFVHTFFFQHHGVHRDLHSFPTRRSSDLDQCRHRSRSADPDGRTHEGDLRRRDRKSTRLNSSHANISYAVFCLKKKNITSSISTTTTSAYYSTIIPTRSC